MTAALRRAMPLSRRERQIGYALVLIEAVVYTVLWIPVLDGHVKLTGHGILANPEFILAEGLVLMAITAIMIQRDRRRIAGGFAMLVAIGAGWGNLVIAAFPILAWGVFVGFKANPEVVAARRAAREARRSGKGKTGDGAATEGTLLPHRPTTASKRYTPPKRRATVRRRGTSSS
ncbi:hypothetical protein [Acidimicrobium ferrooxidans]|uniref:hypothetical protein n=1 Tax=Acidimicrobium ferrooxidans TaxID=53635 RepID=UPI00019DE55D|nr:hypothetical protein [Acidimicrobium ferrooxidans]